MKLQGLYAVLLPFLRALLLQVDLTKYTLPNYMGIVTYKTAYYSFYLPVACGLVLADRADEGTLKLAQDICLQMGQYFQVISGTFWFIRQRDKEDRAFCLLEG